MKALHWTAAAFAVALGALAGCQSSCGGTNINNNNSSTQANGCNTPCAAGFIKGADCNCYQVQHQNPAPAAAPAR